MSSSSEDEKLNSGLVHLPEADELSAILSAEEFIMGMSAQCNNNNKILSSANSIKHWAHYGHDLQLMTVNDFPYEKDNDKTTLQCDGCVKLIRADDHHQFYGCVPCKYFLHTFCAELPEEIVHYPSPSNMIFAHRDSEKFKFFECNGCGVFGNGIFFSEHRYYTADRTSYRVHIGCATLPKTIKHEAHTHKLNRVLRRSLFPSFQCQACGRTFDIGSFHVCEECEISLCGGCIMKPRTVNHPWDPHPMRLIYEPGMVSVHEHDFNCEYCSEDIDPNFWFYHCSECDLSFHLQTCFERSRHNEYSNIKFGATDIIIDKLHPHGLTFVLNKKVRSCGNCHQKLLGKPVLECPAAPCKAVFCTDCSVAARRDIYTVDS
nr:PREDICTED: uncharacterized protein LOC108226892 [Daucus carota subsp. sativus]